jgi:hypothetical protein
MYLCYRLQRSIMWHPDGVCLRSARFIVKLLPLPQPPVCTRTDVQTNLSAQRATQLRCVLACVYAVSIQNQITNTVP